MAYIRTDRNCNPVVQPGNINVTDTYGNTNDFFHVDYVRCDRECNPNPIPFDPNNPQNVTHTNPDVLFFDTNWTRRLVDNSAGVKSQYVRGNRIPSIANIILPDDTYSNTDLLVPVYLATEGDDDLWIVDEANDDIFVIDFTEPLEIDQEGKTIGHLLVDETGGFEVVNELNNPIQINN